MRVANRKQSGVTVIFTLLLAGLCAGPSAADDAIQEVLEVATMWTRSIACMEWDLSPADVVALQPRVSVDEFSWEGRYAVLWLGDLGCQGGSGSAQTYITIVETNHRGVLKVNPRSSSPAVRFDLPFKGGKVVGHTADSIVIEGWKHGPRDALCCPSIRARVTMRRDRDGHWRLAD